MKTPTAALFALAWLGAAALPALARSPAEAMADDAQSQLSARYTALWSHMPAAERSSFSRAERHWLHVQRWSEQRGCVEALGPRADPGDVEARCLAEVTLRHLRELPPAALAAR